MEKSNPTDSTTNPLAFLTISGQIYPISCWFYKFRIYLKNKSKLKYNFKGQKVDILKLNVFLKIISKSTLLLPLLMSKIIEMNKFLCLKKKNILRTSFSSLMDFPINKFGN